MFWWDEEEEEKVEEEKVDRISELPLDIIHRILSFIELREAIQTCILSKRWRYVWKSLPYLNFIRHYSHLNFRRIYTHKVKFSDFVDNLLNLRDDPCPIWSFYLRYDSSEELPNHGISKCIETNNLEVLYLDNLSGDKKYQLPLDTIFTSKSLRILKLKYEYSLYDFPKLEIPNSISLPRLEKLTIGRVHLDEDDDIKKILLNCHVLESLSFDGCMFSQNNFEISSPNLKHLKMYHCQYISSEDDRQICTININAQNLLSLRCIYPKFCRSYYSSYPDIQKSLEFRSVICESLETFKLKTFGDSKLCSMFSPKLKKLVLVRLEGETDALNSMFSSCPLLESVSLKECEFGDNILDICGLQLKHLKIYGGAVESIKLYAPNLISLQIDSFKWKYFDTGNFSTLVNANIDLKFAEARDTFQCETPNIDDQMRKLYLPPIVKLLRAFHKVKVLTLSYLVIMLLSEAPSLLENLLEFSNLTCLDLSTWLLRDSINVISHLLEISPNVESLIMKTNSGDDNELKLIKVSLQGCNFHHLKEVKIYGPGPSRYIEKYKGYDYLMFVTRLLKKANNLQNVTLNLFRYEELTEAARLAKDFPRVAPFVTFLLSPERPDNWS